MSQTWCFARFSFLFYCWFSEVSNVYGLSSQQKVASDVSFGGVTALLRIPNTAQLFLGTKKGLLYSVDSSVWQSFDDVAQALTTSSCELLTNPESSRKAGYPIYCMDYTCDGSSLFCGAGDRHVAVWNRQARHWTQLQRLGPHTGWVKGLTFNEKTGNLHSIGCNHIESWTLTNEELDSQQWVKIGTSTIDSSPAEGCTLSSDLLCMCLLSLPSSQYLFAGGVDGRIHVWDASSMGESIAAIAAHSGRLNAMTLDSDSKMLLTAGSDGSFKCWDCRDLESALETRSWKPITTLELGSQIRITALSDVVLMSKTMILLGTQTGEVLLVALPIRESSDKTPQVVAKVNVLDDAMIYALCVLPRLTQGKNEDSLTVLVGHSKGVTTCEFT